MSQLPNINRAASADQQAFGNNNTLNELQLDDFLNLMIAELQNQDPLNPLENDELIAQISQIREVGATEQLTETLNSVLLGQNISSATNLIGADVVALNDAGQRVTGNVRVVSITDGQPRLDLALDTEVTSPAETEGSIDSGSYNYAVVWESSTTPGEFFGVEIDGVRTNTLADFAGAIQLNNLPPTETPKKVYRTDSTGEGERKLVGEIRRGQTSTYVDKLADDSRGETLTSEVFRIDFARKETVSLNNVGEIRPPQGQ